MKNCRNVKCIFYSVNSGCQAAVWGEIDELKKLESKTCDLFVKESGIGTYGQRHRTYIEENHEVFFENKLLDGELENYLIEINKRACESLNSMLQEKIKIEEKKGNIPKETLQRAAYIENLKSSCEEIILKEIVYHI